MTRELAGLDIDLTNVDSNSGYATFSELKNKSQVPDVARENNLPSKPAINNTHYNEAATSSNMLSPHSNNSELITLSNAIQKSTKMQWSFPTYGAAL